jgi:hypothetical protein
MWDFVFLDKKLFLQSQNLPDAILSLKNVCNYFKRYGCKNRKPKQTVWLAKSG